MHNAQCIMHDTAVGHIEASTKIPSPRGKGEQKQARRGQPQGACGDHRVGEVGVERDAVPLDRVLRIRRHLWTRTGACQQCETDQGDQGDQWYQGRCGLRRQSPYICTLGELGMVDGHGRTWTCPGMYTAAHGRTQGVYTAVYEQT